MLTTQREIRRAFWLGAALSEVDYYEIAEALFDDEDLKEDEEETADAETEA